MRTRHAVDLHKGSTGLLVLGLMAFYENFGLGPWVYLALHGSYGVLWVTKSYVFPDPAWEAEIPLWKGIFYFCVLLTYWVAPWLLVSSRTEPPYWLVSLAIFTHSMGVFLHFVSDAQKYYVLKVKRGLITDGFFARTRNPNYLGEILIYGSFSMLTQSWIPFAIQGIWIAGVFIPNMLKKERSMSRYNTWQAYTARSGLLFPVLFGASAPESSTPQTHNTQGPPPA